MTKRDKKSEGRLEGMYYAYCKIKDVGMDEFAKELSFRSQRGVQLVNTKHDVQKFEREVIGRIQDVVMIFAVAVLVDEFDFGNEEVNRFLDRLQLKSDCISDHYITWDEQKKILKDEMGIEINFRSRKGESDG